MEATHTRLPGVIHFKPSVFGDARGYFVETWSERRYREAGVGRAFVQDNTSKSGKGTLRGLHLQNPFAQGKLVRVVVGSVFDVAVDVRRGSPHYGKWTGVELSEQNHHQLYIPPGFAHGFCVTSDVAVFAYKCTEYYHPESEVTIAYDDPELAISWPVQNPRLSAKDQAGTRLAQLDPEKLPRYEAEGGSVEARV